MDMFTEMYHVQNFETICQRLDILSDRYLYNRKYNARDKKNPKDIILILGTGVSFGITTFLSYFIEYVEAEILVKDVTKIN